MTINIGGGELKELKPRILVMGIGGAGGNAINAMIDDGLQGVELVNQARKEQDRINDMRMNEPDKYEEYLDELESYGDFSA